MHYSKTRQLITAATISLLLTNCASQFPQVEKTKSLSATRQASEEAFEADQGPAIERIRVPASTMKPSIDRAGLPTDLANKKIDINFAGNTEADLNSLLVSLAATGLQINFKWIDPDTGIATPGKEGGGEAPSYKFANQTGGSNQFSSDGASAARFDKGDLAKDDNAGSKKNDEDYAALLKRRLPFVNFSGKVGDLMQALRNGMGIAYWYEDGMIYLSETERYTVTVPQNGPLIKTIETELKSLGAKNITASVRGGKIIYSASPNVQDDYIAPYLARMQKNLSVINLQVAVVSLALNDKSEQGFDWDSFKLAFDSTDQRVKSVTDGTTYNPHTDGASSASTPVDDPNPLSPNTIGDVISATGTGLSLGKTSTGSLFGTYGALNVTSAIKFLSKFGHTNVTQNVSLKTISGSDVAFNSGQEVPYVKGVSNTTTGTTTSSTTGSSDTDKVKTGLSLVMTPLYDGDSQLVTVDVEMALNSILQYVELNAGNEIGKFTQPVVQNQSLKDLVQAQAGKTIVIGGLQYDSEDFSGNEPMLLREKLAETGKSIGKRANETKRSALFIILRPSVTVYEAE